MKNQDITKVNVELNALCYALWQAEDYIPVVFLKAEEDDEIHFKQMQLLANACLAAYMRSSDEERDNCHQWSSRIVAIANCSTLEDYKKL